ncbi:MAG: redoxin domain-containing protein [Prevotella sp.]|nr:redoxin domain-containing protein [Prevotella sp.]
MKKLFLVGCCLLMSILSAQAQDLDSLYAQEMLRHGVEAPDFVIDSASNAKLKDLRGRFVVLHFWASWCPDCRRDTPEMNRLHDEFASDSLVFIHISFDTDRQRWTNYYIENQMEGLHFCEMKKMRESAVARAYGIKWIPSYYVLNTEGKVILATVQIEKLRKRLGLLDYSRVSIPRSRRACEPTFPGGDDVMMSYIARHIRYPRLASNYGLQGQTVVKFLVETDGSISNVHVVANRITVDDRLVFQRLAGDEKRRIREQVLELFAEEAVRVVSGMPKWKPGVRNGIPMKVEYELPINFKIDYGIHEMG